MLFSSQLTARILDRRKTETRRIVKPGKDGAAPRCYYTPGRDYSLERPMRLDEADPVQAAIITGRRRGRPPRKEVGRILVTSVERAQVGDIDFAGARAEGFPSPVAWREYWVRLHDRAWCRRNEPSDDGPLTLEQIEHRFCARWATVEVWVIRFELIATTLYLAERPGRGGDYVTRERDPQGRQIAMTTEVDGWATTPELIPPAGVGTVRHNVPEEAVNPEIIDGWINDRRGTSTHQQIKRRIADEGKTARHQRELDRKLLSFEDRIRAARQAARLSSINVSSEIRAFQAAYKKNRRPETLEQRVRAVERRAYREEHRAA